MLTVLVIRSLSYTGTTWFNTILGANEDTFTIGIADRLFSEKQNCWETLCIIHGRSCELWPGLFPQINFEENIYLQLSKMLKKRVLVINNPIQNGEAEKHLRHPDIMVKEVRLVRNGLAICASYKRKYPEKTFKAAVDDFFFPSASVFEFDPDDSRALSLQYEKVVEDTTPYLKLIGSFIGIDYSMNALNFWNYPLHLTGGNMSIASLDKYMNEGKEITDSFYKEKFELENSSKNTSFKDDRWRSELSPDEIQYYLGKCALINQKWGYPND